MKGKTDSSKKKVTCLEFSFAHRAVELGTQRKDLSDLGMHDEGQDMLVIAVEKTREYARSMACDGFHVETRT